MKILTNLFQFVGQAGARRRMLNIIIITTGGSTRWIEVVRGSQINVLLLFLCQSLVRYGGEANQPVFSGPIVTFVLKKIRICHAQENIIILLYTTKQCTV